MNKKLYNYFNKGVENSLFTILGFQKNIEPKNLKFDIYKNILHDEGHRFLSFCILFDHRTCRIERFLINYGIPYIYKKVEIDRDSLNRKGDLAFNHLLTHDPVFEIIKSDKLKLDKFNDGKLTASFILAFMTQCFHSIYHLKDSSFNGIYDVKGINTLREFDKDFLDSLKIINNRIFELDDSKPMKINITERFFSCHMNKNFRNLEAFDLNPVTFKTLPKCFQELRRHINGRVFVDNADLRYRIHMYNELMQKRIKELSVEY